MDSESGEKWSLDPQNLSQITGFAETRAAFPKKAGRVESEKMSHLQRVASILGTVLLGMAAYLVISENRENRGRRSGQPPVEELAEELKQAWAGHHNR